MTTTMFLLSVNVLRMAPLTILISYLLVKCIQQLTPIPVHGAKHLGEQAISSLV
jgi:hypothetical protein